MRTKVAQHRHQVKHIKRKAARRRKRRLARHHYKTTGRFL
jgi:hypothetical protein